MKFKSLGMTNEDPCQERDQGCQTEVKVRGFPV